MNKSNKNIIIPKAGLTLLISCVLLQGCNQKTIDGNSLAEQSSSILPAASSETVLASNKSQLQALQPADPSAEDTTPQNWWFGQQVDAENRPVQCVQMQEQLGMLGLTALGPQSDTVYLTFDFGYETGYSGAILDILKQKQATATFFVVQQFASQEKETVSRMVSEGHSVGSHSITHPGAPNGLAGLSITHQQEEIGALGDILQEEYGYACYLFRAPEGIYSRQTLATAANTGYHSVFWSYGYNDWSPDAQPNVAESLQKALDAAHPGAIYLLHPQSTNTEMLAALIDGFREKGYQVKGL